MESNCVLGMVLNWLYPRSSLVPDLKDEILDFKVMRW